MSRQKKRKYKFIDYGNSKYRIEVIEEPEKTKKSVKIQKKGGQAVVMKYGREYMSQIAKKSRENRKKKDPNYGKKLSALGVFARKNKKKESIVTDKTITNINTT